MNLEKQVLKNINYYLDVSTHLKDNNKINRNLWIFDLEHKNWCVLAIDWNVDFVRLQDMHLSALEILHWLSTKKFFIKNDQIIVSLFNLNDFSLFILLFVLDVVQINQDAQQNKRAEAPMTILHLKSIVLNLKVTKTRSKF